MNDNSDIAKVGFAAEKWELRQPYGPKTFGLLFIAAVILAVSAHRSEVDKGIAETGRAVAYSVGLAEDSKVATGTKKFVDESFPLVISNKTAVSRIEDFDPDNLPLFSSIIEEPIKKFDAEKNEVVTAGHEEYLYQPVGYVTFVGELLLETLELAVWGTILSIGIAIPLAYFGAKGYSPNRFSYSVARAVCSFNRAIPELIAALIFAFTFGPGSVAGILALGIHTSGFLGKFFADDIENSAKGPQEALFSTGASKIRVLRLSVIPQILPQVLAYCQYILERNFRSATVLGIVGAGGIGVELKGRWDQFDYGHVSTILLAIFLTVLALETFTQRMRTRLIAE